MKSWYSQTVQEYGIDEILNRQISYDIPTVSVLLPMTNRNTNTLIMPTITMINKDDDVVTTITNKILNNSTMILDNSNNIKDDFNNNSSNSAVHNSNDDNNVNHNNNNNNNNIIIESTMASNVEVTEHEHEIEASQWRKRNLAIDHSSQVRKKDLFRIFLLFQVGED